MKKKFSFLLIYLAVFSLITAGCGGGLFGSHGTGGSSGQDTGGLKIAINWPDKAEKYISTNTVNINISITGDGLSSAQQASIAYGQTSLTVRDLPAGQKSVEVSAVDASGNVLSHRISSVYIQPSQIASVSMDLGVTILDTGFTPQTIIIPAGTTLLWVNAGSRNHSLNDSAPFDNTLLASGENVSYTFNTAGTYTYSCGQYPTLTGTVIVTPVPPTWEGCLGGNGIDAPYSIIQTSDGGYIVAGDTTTLGSSGDVSGNHGLQDFWVVKIGPSETIEWQKCLGGTGEDEARSIIQTSDGGYIVAGTTQSNDGDVSGLHGVGDFWVVKLGSTGTIEWQKCLGGSLDDMAYSIQQTSDGGYITAGFTRSNDGDVAGGGQHLVTVQDYWVVKLSSTGTIEWQKCLGGTGQDEAYSVQQTSDGGYIIAGWAGSNNGDVTGNHGWTDYWIVKLNSTGDITWEKCLGGSLIEVANAIQQTSDGGYIVAGRSQSNDGDVSGNHGDYDYWVVKINSTGNITWQKCLGGTARDDTQSIQQTSDGGYIVTGDTASNDNDVSGNHGGASDIWTVKINSSGTIQWQKCLGGSNLDSAESIIQTSDGRYVFAGFTESNDGDVTGYHTNGDYWIVAIDSDGNL